MKVGDYVEIRPGVHDSEMPDGRRDGLVIEEIYSTWSLKGFDQVLIMFSNGAILKFHASQVKVLNESR